MARKSKSGQSQSTISLTSTTNEDGHLKTLAEHKHIYDFYLKTGEVVGLHPHIKGEIVNAFKVENPHYHYNQSCSACTCEMLVTVYRWFENKIK